MQKIATVELRGYRVDGEDAINWRVVEISYAHHWDGRANYDYRRHTLPYTGESFKETDAEYAVTMMTHS
ncbi:hypothetical protein JNJ66_06175 [Candidatus Saccharibacteria bacterium]|nr:hypothetical protein [Candidatus Saccharibacteria bacterium]